MMIGTFTAKDLERYDVEKTTTVAVIEPRVAAQARDKVAIEDKHSKELNRSHINIGCTISFLEDESFVWFTGIDNLLYGGAVLLATHLGGVADRVVREVPGKPIFTTEDGSRKYAEEVIATIVGATGSEEREVIRRLGEMVLVIFDECLEQYVKLKDTPTTIFYTTYNDIALYHVTRFGPCGNVCGNLWKAYTYNQVYNLGFRDTPLVSAVIQGKNRKPRVWKLPTRHPRWSEKTIATNYAEIEDGGHKEVEDDDADSEEECSEDDSEGSVGDLEGFIVAKGSEVEMGHHAKMLVDINNFGKCHGSLQVILSL